jgi:uncharacterized protein (DUF4415 family)
MAHKLLKVAAAKAKKTSPPKRNKRKEAALSADFPELSDEQLAAMRPAREVMPVEFFEAVKRKQGQRGPGVKPAKVHVSMRLDPLVVETFKAGGKNWQRDINETLLRVVKRRKDARAERS